MRFNTRSITILFLFVFLASAVLGFSTQSISDNLSISLDNPTSGDNHLTDKFTITLLNATENATCVLWGNWTSWAEKTTTTNMNLTNSTYNLTLSNLSAWVHNTSYKWAVNCSSQTNLSDYQLSTNETFVYLNQTILDNQDQYEYNDVYTSANYILTNGTKQYHSFYPAGDEDWIAFNATQNESYRIETGDLLNGADTFLALYDVNHTTRIAFNDDVVTNGPFAVHQRSLIEWTAPANGTYYLNVTDLVDNVGNYTISVTAYPDLSLSFVNFTTFAQQNTFFTVYVNVTCNGGNCTNIPIYLDPKKIKEEKIIDDSNILNNLDELDDNILYDVIVTLKDVENIIEEDSLFSTKSKSVNINRLNARQKQVKNIRERVFDDLGLGKNSFGTMSSSDVLIVREYEVINAFAASMTKDALEDLQNNPFVEKVAFEETFTITNDDSIPMINADDVWLEQSGGNYLTGIGQTICIVDTGIAYGHADFGGNASFPNQKVIGGYDFVNDDADPMDDDYWTPGHGSHVAGTAAGEDATFTGVAPGAKLVAVKACNNVGSCLESDILAGIDWCVYHADEYNISVISLSIGAGNYSTYCDDQSTAKAVNYAADQGLFVAVAAGNDHPGENTVSVPACASGAFTVSSIRKDDFTIDFDRGPLTDILAPGYSITSTYYTGSHGVGSGTSMSTPHVAGAAALLNQYYYSLTGELRSADDIKEAFIASGPLRNDSSSNLSFPRLDVLAALNEPINKGIISTNSSATPFYTTSANPQIINLTQGEVRTLNWSVNATGDYASYEFYAFAPLTAIGEEELSDIQNLTIVDSSVPVVVALGPANQSPINISAQTLQFNISDNYSTTFDCDLYINGTVNDSGSFGLGANEFEINFIDDTYNWYVNCSDPGSLWGVTDLYEITTRDTSVPIISLQSPSATLYTQNLSTNVTYQSYDSAYGIANCSVLVNGTINATNAGVVESTNTTEELSLTEGINSWSVLCYDNSPQNNNATSSSRNIIVDQTNPNTTIVLTGTIGSNGWYKSQVQMSLTVNETNIDESYYNYSGSLWSTYLGVPFILPNGNLSMQYYSIDLAGNNETIKIENISIDSVVPVVENFTTSPQSPAEDYQVILLVDASDVTSGIANMTVSINSGAWNLMSLQLGSTYAYNYTPANDENYTIEIKAIDLAGTETIEEFWMLVGIGSNGDYDFIANTTIDITNVSAKTNASVGVNTSVNGTFNVTEFTEQPLHVNTSLTNAIRYASFETDQAVIDVLDWVYVQIDYLAADIYGYKESTFEIYWFNETDGTWTEIDDALSYIIDTDHEATPNYLWANATVTGTFAIALDKLECVDVYDDEKILAYCFDETDTLRSSGYMCDDEYQTSSCDTGDVGGGGSGGGFSTYSSTNITDDEPEVIATSSSSQDDGIPALARTSGNNLGTAGSDNSEIDSSAEEAELEHKLTLGNKIGFLALLIVVIGIVVYAYHYRDKTHRLTVAHKLKRYLDDSKESEWIREDYADEILAEGKEKPLDLYEQQRQKLESHLK